MASVASLIVNIGADISSLTSGVSSAASTVQQFGANVAALGKRMTLGITAPLMAIGAASVKTAADF